MDYSTILYDLEDNVLLITLNRPEILNAFNREMMTETIDALDKADADKSIETLQGRIDALVIELEEAKKFKPALVFPNETNNLLQ